MRFFGAARRYWLSVFPCVSAELSAWHRRAGAIPDSHVRSLALEAERKRGNMEGAAIFAAFAPRRHRRDAIGAAVRFQSAYNYVDLLGEQPCEQPRLNGYRLHEALLVALRPGAAHPPYYAHFAPRRPAPAFARPGPASTRAGSAWQPEELVSPDAGAPLAVDDGGYLADLVTGCQRALRRLPSLPAVSDAALRAAERVVCFQALNSGHEDRGHAPLADWGRSVTPASSGLTWWEAAAAAGSSLGVFVLIAAAADPSLEEADVTALDDAYFPWIGGLHSLLDNVVDTDEDAATGQLSLLSHYPTGQVAADRLRWLAARSRAAASELPSSVAHVLALGAMAGFYLSEREAAAGGVRLIRDGVSRELGLPAHMAVVVFRIRRCIGEVNRRVRRGGAVQTADVQVMPPIAALGEVRGVAASDRRRPPVEAERVASHA